MDDKPLRFPPPTLPQRSDQQNDDDNDDDDEQASSSTTDAAADDDRPKKRTRRVVDSSTTCAPEQLHCRYANKKCLNPRAVKRTGGLHTFCAMHRANANRNQRRLDMRKRMARQALKAQAAAAAGGQVADAAAATTLKTETVVTNTSTTDGHAQYEPLQTPTPLQAEDISTLVTLFLPPLTPRRRADGTFGFQLDAPMTPTTPHDWSSSESTGGNTPPPPVSGGMRF
ncbi:hypothetical protein PHYSODRAFT_488838 [Phytophthora sojae]|uniref:Uncharacterized protein n=1 Tax=Phytophthora sojae (strain P6497) TaxID=1094619 RepID=G4Z2E4_PHYSP|nr:hypothetical protein PHYSODRAFT_488838 [Phytophthora sojae]EGZ19985.1 hypothetical protein PHYSODRAFT_488838 [Phytophthora sojae]|eukprot:XP_009522702.1 hypothetical protein PHYSODRAFT_488838 [Phytophthora sojae]